MRKPQPPPSNWQAQACGAALVAASTALLAGAGAGLAALFRGTASADATYALLAGPLSVAGSLVFLYLAWLARELYKSG